MVPCQGFSPPLSFSSVPSWLRLSRLPPNRRYYPIFFSHSSSVPAYPPRQGWWWSIHPFTPVSEVLLTLTVLLSPHLLVVWCCKNAGTPGISCGFCPLFPHQRNGFLRRLCRIDAQSDQCDEAIVSFLWIVVIWCRCCSRSSAQIFVCCGGAPGLWRQRGRVNPGALLLLPWRVSPVPWRAWLGTSLISVVCLQVLLMM